MLQRANARTDVVAGAVVLRSRAPIGASRLDSD